MISPKNIRFYYWGIILCSFLVLIITFGNQKEFYSFEFWAPMIFPFLGTYLLLYFIKNRVVKIVFIFLELLWMLFITFMVFILEEYKFGEYILELLLIILNTFLRIVVLLNLFTFKNKKTIVLLLSILIPILIYSYGSTEHLRIGF